MSDAEEINQNDVVRLFGDMVKTRAQTNGWIVQTPLLYPSGTAVGISIVGPSDTFTVSDAGIGFSEAFAMDVAYTFGRAAKQMAEEFGISYDKRRLFIPAVSKGRLESAVRLVANCSQSAVIRAVDRSNERKAEERADRLYARLKSLFPNTAKRAQLPGGSNTEWTVDALVRAGDTVSVFDTVTAHQNSVSATATKFHDLALLGTPPARCSVVENKAAMGTLLAVLAQAGSVIEDAAPDRQLQQLAVAGHA